MKAGNKGAASDPSEAAGADGQAANGASGGAAGLLLIAGLTLVWGCNWPFIKIALSEAPVWWFRAGCVIAGGGGLLAISALSGARLRPRAKEVPKLIGCSVFAIIGWHVFTGYGVANMGAGRASIIAYTMPLWAALFSVVLIGERLRASTIAGLAFGAGGLAALIGPDIMAIEATPPARSPSSVPNGRRRSPSRPDGSWSSGRWRSRPGPSCWSRFRMSPVSRCRRGSRSPTYSCCR